MSANQASYQIATMSRMLGVSPSGYYAWRNREPSPRSRRDEELKARIQAIHTWSRGTYGAPRIHAELADEGTHARHGGIAMPARHRIWSSVTSRLRGRMRSGSPT